MKLAFPFVVLGVINAGLAVAFYSPYSAVLAGFGFAAAVFFGIVSRRS